MDKIGNKELAESLMEKYSLSRENAERFVTLLFDDLSKGLQADKQIKIKGLGVFKIISVASRKSVDVNTGEPIVIEGRDKINFIPDPTLRDDVNRPFSQFDTVIVNEGVDFSSIDKKYGEDQTVEEDGQESIPVEEKVELKEEREEETAPKEQEVVQTGNTPSGQAELPSNASVEDKDATQVADTEEQEIKETEQAVEATEQVVEATEQEVHATEQAVEATEQEVRATEQEEQKSEKEIAETEKGVDEEKHATKQQAVNLQHEDDAIAEEEQQINNEQDRISEVQSEDEELEKALGMQHRTLKYVIAACAVLLVAIGFGAYYFFTQLQKRDHRIEHLEAQVQEKKTSLRPKTAHELPTSSNVKIVSTESNSTQPGNASPVSADVASDNAKKQPAADSKSAAASDNKPASAPEVREKQVPADKPAGGTTDYSGYNKDIRIRTGAYDIVGIDKVVTLRSGQTFSSISRTYLGAGMECYMEAVNEGRTSFNVGEKINIPKLQLKKKRR